MVAAVVFREVVVVVSVAIADYLALVFVAVLLMPSAAASTIVVSTSAALLIAVSTIAALVVDFVILARMHHSILQ